jgi:hypothetical protein
MRLEADLTKMKRKGRQFTTKFEADAVKLVGAG